MILQNVELFENSGIDYTGERRHPPKSETTVKGISWLVTQILVR